MKTMYFLSKRTERKLLFIIPTYGYHYNRGSMGANMQCTWIRAYNSGILSTRPSGIRITP
jgi:hypothetical protein